MLIHIITEKGRGYTPAETASDKMHGVGKYDIVTGKQIKPSTKVQCNHFAGTFLGRLEKNALNGMVVFGALFSRTHRVFRSG